MNSWQEWVTLVAMFFVAGPVTMLIVQLLKNVQWSAGVKIVLAVVVSVLVGLAGTWISGTATGVVESWGDLTAVEVAGLAGAAFAGATLYYKTWFAGTSWGKKLADTLWPKIE
jgi:uncharacterized membrane protein